MSVATLSQVTNITPPALTASKGEIASSIIVFQEQLYLAIASYQTRKGSNYISVLRYDTEASSWQEMYQSSLLLESNDSDTETPQIAKVDLQIEFAIFQTEDEETETLYLNLISPFNYQLIHSTDGIAFSVVYSAQPSDSAFVPRQQFISYQQQLYALPSSNKVVETTADTPLIYTCSSPQSGEWKSFKAAQFGDSNQGISHTIVFNNFLCAATENLTQGFQIGKMQIDASTLPSWEPLLTKGAYRYSLNQKVYSMAVFQDNLYVASGIANLSSQDTPPPSPCGFELTRLYPEGDWDLIVGTPKFTPDGLKVPLSAMGAGFDEPYNQRIQSLVVHKDHIYLCFEHWDGFQLWRSEDGEIWEQVSFAQLNEYHNVMVKGALSTSTGLAFLVNVNRTSEMQLLIVDL